MEATVEEATVSRMYNTSTRLGQTMAARGWTVGDFAVATGINARTLSDYLAARKVMLREHLWSMADVLEVAQGDIDNQGEVAG